jgi:hypothetical protein
MKLEFEAKLDWIGPNRTWCFFAAPFNVEKVFGIRARVPVRGTINGFPFRSSLMSMEGKHRMCINKPMQAGVKLKSGDVRAQLVLQRDERSCRVTMPLVLKQALAKNSEASAVFEKPSLSHGKEYVEWITGAKQDETRTRRLKQLIPILVAKRQAKG